MNFVAPALQFATSLSRLMNPYVAGKVVREGFSGARSSVARIGVMYAAMGFAYGCVLIVFHEQAFHLLYGNRFAGAADLVSWMGAVPLFYLVLYAPMIGLRAIQSPSSVFVAYSGAAVVALTMGFPLTAALGLKGTIVSLCAANAVGAVLGVWLFLKKTKPLADESACPTLVSRSSV
jgi:O-antigen/teichoic acid export membrane protein